MDPITSRTPPETRFAFICESVCFDFTNTVGGLRGMHSREDLTQYPDLASWSCQANLLTEREEETLLRKAERDEVEAALVLRRAYMLREAIYHIFTALIAGKAACGISSGNAQ